MRIVSSLERTAYVFLISLCLVSGGILIRRQWVQYKFQASVPALTAKSVVGRQFDVPGVSWSTSDVNAVLFLSTRCHFCEASMPFYRRLSQAHRQTIKKRVALLGVSREPSGDLQNHLADNHVELDRVYQIPSTLTLLSGTPTLLIIDGSGVIRQAFVGELSDAQEQKVLAFVRDGSLASINVSAEVNY